MVDTYSTRMIMELNFCMWRSCFLAHRIRTSENLPLDRNSFLTYQCLQERVVALLAPCRQNLSHIATYVRQA